MRIGTLDRRVEIQRDAGTTQNAANEEIEDWRKVATVWASIVPLSGTERIVAEQTQADVTHTVTLRYRAGVTPKMRIIYGERRLEILSVVEGLKRRRELILNCKELV